MDKDGVFDFSMKIFLGYCRSDPYNGGASLLRSMGQCQKGSPIAQLH